MLKAHRGAGKWLIVIGALGTMCIFLLISVFQYLRHGSRDVSATRSLMMIGVALHSYHTDYGSFPPAYVADELGNPKHSWRVLLLPYFGYDQLYARYNFDQPWDSPDNLAVAAEGCAVYTSPTGFLKRDLTTPFLAVVGPRTAWPGDYGVRMQDITDRLFETILVLDCVASDVKWTEPRDLTFADALSLGGAGIHLRTARSRPNGVLYLDALGTVSRLPRDFSLSLLKSLLTIDSGETIPDEEWQEDRR
jgi:hypothetical protein